jgi:arginine-tRNA-protein transferase
MSHSNTLQFYQDKGHACSYLDDQQARNIYPDPNLPMSNVLYSRLIQLGFRRSGDFSYRPYCDECQACVPVRINHQQFVANRSQRRCLKRNQDITMKVVDPFFDERHFELYQHYISQRHIGGGMDDPSPESYMGFIHSGWSDTVLLEFHLQHKLVGVAVTDLVGDGASAFYTFFDPDLDKRSLGTYAILQQLELIKGHRLPYLYLGYWIKNCRKMSYKQNFSGLEGFIKQRWQPFETIKTFE